jgi:hypothetical protein
VQCTFPGSPPIILGSGFVDGVSDKCDGAHAKVKTEDESRQFASETTNSNEAQKRDGRDQPIPARAIRRLRLCSNANVSDVLGSGLPFFIYRQVVGDDFITCRASALAQKRFYMDKNGRPATVRRNEPESLIVLLGGYSSLISGTLLATH